MKRFFKITFLLISLLCLRLVIFSQITKTTGINGANMTSFIQKGSKLFAGSTNGFVYVSVDNGTNWSSLSRPDPSSTNAYVTRFYLVGSRLFAGMSNGLCYSDNDGLTWTKLSSISDVVSGILFSNTKFLITTYSGLFISLDTGKTFIQFIDTVISSTTNIKTIYKSGTDIFLGIQISPTNYYELKSTDNGVSWKKIMVPDAPLSIIKSSGRDFIGSNYQTYYSDDGWQTNTMITMPSSYGSGRNYYFLATTSYIFIYFNYGIFRSSNNGNTWTSLPMNKAVTSLTEVGTSLFATTTGGIFYSTDYGNTWSKKDNNITEIVTKRALDVNGRLLLLTQYSGIFASDDNGLSWHPSIAGIPTEPLSDLIVGDNSTLYTVDDVHIIYKSYNKGNTWIADSSFFTRITSIAYAQGKMLGCDGSGNFYRSDTGNITMALSTTLTGINFLKANNQRVFAFTSGGGISSSDDAGQTWTSRYTLGSFAANYAFYFSAEGNNILVNSNNQSFYSADNGITWAKALNKPSTQGALIKNNILYIGGADTMITSNNATTWNFSASYFNNPKAYLTPLLLKAGNLFFAKAVDGVYYKSGFVGIKNTTTAPPEFSVYPNPASDRLFILGYPTMNCKSIQLYDCFGKEIAINVDTNNELDISKLQPGIYFICINGTTGKFMKVTSCGK